MNPELDIVEKIDLILQHGADPTQLIQEEGGFKLNVASVPLAKARTYAAKTFEKHSKNLAEEIPDFDQNYVALQKATKKALDIPRIDMPVIEPADMKKFMSRVRKGHIDIFKPFVKGKEWFPKDLTKGPRGEEFLTLGIQDGDPDDDKLPAKRRKWAANRLKPTQSQIWLEKLIVNIAKFGQPTSSSPIAKATIIVSKEGYILDGHHRYGQAMLANPTLGLDAILIPLDIKTLLKMGRSYGNAVGNQQKG